FTTSYTADTYDNQTTTEQLAGGQRTLTAASGAGGTTGTNQGSNSGGGDTALYSFVSQSRKGYSLSQGQLATSYWGTFYHEHDSGQTPYTGQDATFNYDGTQPYSPVTPPPPDWFATVSNFAAGMGDAVSCGLTQKIRAGLGYDDVV